MSREGQTALEQIIGTPIVDRLVKFYTLFGAQNYCTGLRQIFDPTQYEPPNYLGIRFNPDIFADKRYKSERGRMYIVFSYSGHDELQLQNTIMLNYRFKKEDHSVSLIGDAELLPSEVIDNGIFDGNEVFLIDQNGA